MLTKPAPVLLSLAVLLPLWMFIQEQLNGTALWGMEERWAEVRHLHVLHGIFFFSAKPMAHHSLESYTQVIPLHRLQQ